MFDGRSGSSLIPRKMAGSEMITIELSSVAMNTPRVVLDSAVHLYRSDRSSMIPPPPKFTFTSRSFFTCTSRLAYLTKLANIRNGANMPEPAGPGQRRRRLTVRVGRPRVGVGAALDRRRAVG